MTRIFGVVFGARVLAVFVRRLRGLLTDLRVLCADIGARPVREITHVVAPVAIDLAACFVCLAHFLSLFLAGLACVLARFLANAVLTLAAVGAHAVVGFACTAHGLLHTFRPFLADVSDLIAGASAVFRVSGTCAQNEGCRNDCA